MLPCTNQVPKSMIIEEDNNDINSSLASTETIYHSISSLSTFMQQEPSLSSSSFSKKKRQSSFSPYPNPTKDSSSQNWHIKYDLNEHGQVIFRDKDDAIQNIVDINTLSVHDGLTILNEMTLDITSHMISLGLSPQNIPKECRGHIWTSSNVSVAEKVLVLIGSTKGGPGIWSRSLVLNYGSTRGSMLPYIRKALEEGYGVVIVNPDMQEKKEEESFLQYAWRNYIFNSASHFISFIPFGYGGVLMKELLQSNFSELKARVGGIVFIESHHKIDFSEKSMRSLLSSRAIHWGKTSSSSISSSSSSSSKGLMFGQEIQGSDSNIGCIQLSCGEIHDVLSPTSSNDAYTLLTVLDATFRYFKSPSSLDYARREGRRRNEVVHQPNQNNIHIPRTLHDAKMSIDDFKLLKVIGKGSFGKVMLVKKKKGIAAGNVYALKVLKKADLIDRNQVEHTNTEKRILQVIDHPFITKLRFSFQNETKLYLVMDYFTGGTLYFHCNRLHQFSESVARFFSAQLILAIGHLHSMHITYRDMKLENVLVDSDGYVALTDFGLSRQDVNSSKTSSTFCGTPEYIAPELLTGGCYGQAVDWWAFGIMLYEMIVGKTPFYATNRKDTFYNILHQPVHYPSYLSRSVRSLLASLLVRNPKDRMGSDGNDTIEIKDHPFFASVQWEKLYKRQVKSPFRLPVKGNTDVRHVSKVYTNEIPVDSIVSYTLDEKHKECFTNFTYMDETQFSITPPVVV